MASLDASIMTKSLDAKIHIGLNLPVIGKLEIMDKMSVSALATLKRISEKSSEHPFTNYIIPGTIHLSLNLPVIVDQFIILLGSLSSELETEP